MSNQPSSSTKEVQRKNSDYLAFDKLPLVVIEKIILNLSFDEMSRLRQTCKLLKVHSERQLNEGFSRLGRQLSSSAAKLKKQLPKKESERRSHPLNRYSEVFSALETRYTLLSMTYKKFIDLRICCFIPGKVLDVAYGVMKQIHTHLANAALGKNVAVLDVIQILRDIRDYSSMAMEHFDENIAPNFPNKPTIFHALRAAPGNVPTFLSSYYNGVNFANNVSDPSTDEDDDVGERVEALRSEMRTGFEEKDRIIDEQRKELAQTRQFVGQVVALLGQVGRQDQWNQAFMSELDQISAGCQIPGTRAPIGKRIQKVLTKKKPKSPVKAAQFKEVETKYVKSKYTEDSSSDYELIYERVDVEEDSESKSIVSNKKGAPESSASQSAHYGLRKRNPEGFTSFAYPAKSSALKTGLKKAPAELKRKAAGGALNNKKKVPAKRSRLI